jgi:ribosomal protein L5
MSFFEGGRNLAGLGSDKLVIGVRAIDSSSPFPSRVMIFNLSGAHLITIPSPNRNFDGFGTVIQGNLAAITGQKAVVTRAKQAISNFKLKEKMPIGVKVTLHGDRMWEFLERLISIALPRVRDFRGIPRRGFDGRGNYTFGVKEQVIFLEVNFDKITQVLGMDVTFVTSARDDEGGRALLTALGMPFRK